MIRAAAAAAAVALLTLISPALLATASAAAIETTSFGIDHAGDGRLAIPIRAGSRTTARAEVWNKTDAPVTLELRVVPAEVDEGGAPKLGAGDSEAASWVKLRQTTVELAAQERREVVLAVEPPDRLSKETKTFAVLAQLAAEPGGAPAVLQRLALIGYLEPDPAALEVRSIPMWLIVVAALVLIAVVVVAIRRVTATRAA